MAVNFEVVGKLRGMKESGAFKPFDVKNFDSGWQITRYRFNVISGTNRIQVEISGGKWSDDKKNKILTYAKSSNGKKGDPLEVKWVDRNNPDIIDKVAGYRVYTCNLLSFADAKDVDEDTKTKKVHHFLEQTDYAAFVKKVIDSGKYSDAKFKVSGTVDYQYSLKDGQYYKTMQIKKIYKVDNDAEEYAHINFDAFYTEDSVDTDGHLFNCWAEHYFNNIKENRFVPLVLKFHGNKTAAFEKLLKNFDDEATVRKIGLLCDIIDGSEIKSITLEDLTDEVREMVEMELLTLEEAAKDLGGGKAGDYKTEIRVHRPTAKGTEATVFTEDDLMKKPVPNVEEEPESDNDDEIDESDDDIDLFGDI